MNLLPIPGPATRVDGAVTDPATVASGDFTALLAMLVGAASTTLPRQRPPADGDFESAESPAPAPALPAPAIAETALTACVPAPSAATSAEAPVAEVPPPTAPGMPVADEDPPRGVVAMPAADLAGPPPAAEVAGPPRAADFTAPPPAANFAGPPPRADFAGPRRAADFAEPPSAADLAGPPPAADRPGRAEPVPPGLVPRGDRRVLDGGPERRASAAPAATGPQIPAVPAEQPVGPSDMPLSEKAEGVPAPKINATVAPSAGSANPVLPLVAVNRSEALIPADAPATTPVVPPAVPDQIVSAVVPLHGRGDGRHEVTLELRPDHLGAIRVEVSVEQQTVHVTLHAADPATSRLLTAALPDLRNALGDAGLTAGHVGVGPDGRHGADQWRNPSGTGETNNGRPSAGPGAPALNDDSEPLRSVRPARAGRLDLLL